MYRPGVKGAAWYCEEHGSQSHGTMAGIVRERGLSEEIERTGHEVAPNITPSHTSWEAIRGTLEKIAWKHYDPESSINVEEMLDEMMPAIQSTISQELQREREEILAAIPDPNKPGEGYEYLTMDTAEILRNIRSIIKSRPKE